MYEIVELTLSISCNVYQKVIKWATLCLILILQFVLCKNSDVQTLRRIVSVNIICLPIDDI